MLRPALSHEIDSSTFLGEIVRWTDARITDAKPGVILPELPITVAVRADSSGTAAVFTEHLAAINDEYIRLP